MLSQKISFSNTIMIPSILKESQTERQNDDIIIKTDSSEDERNNNSMKKQILSKERKIEFDNKDEDKDKRKCATTKNKDKEKKENLLEKNPYFNGKKFSMDMTPHQNDNFKNEDREIKKVFTMNSRNKNRLISFSNMHLKTSKEMLKNIIIII